MKRSFPQLFTGIRVRRVEDYPHRFLGRCATSPRRAAGADRRRAASPGPYNTPTSSTASSPATWASSSSWAGPRRLRRPRLPQDDPGARSGSTSSTAGSTTTSSTRRRSARQPARRARPDRAYRAGTSRWQMRSGPAWPTTRRSTRYVPDMIRFYLSEEPLLPNVPTYLRRDADSRVHALDAPRRDSSSSRSTSPEARASSSARGQPRSSSRHSAGSLPGATPAIWIGQELVSTSRRRRWWRTTASSSPATSTSARSPSSDPNIKIVPGGLTRVCVCARAR